MDSQTLNSKIILITLIAGIFFLNFLARTLPSPLMPAIESDLGLDHAEAGGFFLLISIGYCFSLVASGFISSRVAHRKVITLSSVAIGFALLFIAVSQTLWAINIGMVVLGLSAGIYLPSGITTITASISPSNWGKAIAIHELATALAYIAAPLVSEFLLGWYSWQGVVASLGGVSILTGFLFHRLARGGDFTGDAPSFANVRSLVLQPGFWIMAILFSLGIATSLGIFSMLPLYLVVERGFDRYYANTVIALSRVPSMIWALLSGWVSDRLGPKQTIKIVLIFNGVMTVLLGIVPGNWVLLMIFLQPMLSACFFPAGFSMLSGISPPNVRNISVSLIIFVAYLIGAGLIPVGMGVLGDMASFELAIVLVGGLILASVVLFRYLKYE